MCVHIADLLQGNARAADGHLQRAGRAVHIGGRDMVSVGREAVPQDLCQDGCAAAPGRFIAFQDNGGRTAAGDKSVPVAVEGAAGCRRVRFPHGERGNAVERAGCGHVHLLRTTADYHFLQAVLDQKRPQADRVRPAGAGAGNREVDALEAENHPQVHGDGRVHGLEDGAAAAEHGVFFLHDLGDGVVDGLRRTVIPVQQAHFVAVQIILVYSGGAQGVPCGTVGVLGRFRHIYPLGAGKFPFQLRFGHIARKAGAEPHGLALRVQDDSGCPLVEGIPHLVQRLAQAGPDTHPRNDDSSLYHVCS